MKLLLLGKNGQVGWELHRALATLGDLVALDRGEADLADPDGLVARVTSGHPDVIVNAAAYTAVDRAEGEGGVADLVNHRAVAALAAEAARTGALLVHYSTDYVFDGGSADPYGEDDRTAPQGVYGATKRAGEEAIVASGCRHLVFRTSWVHAGRGGNFIRTMLRLAGEREELRVVADQTGAPTGAELIADVTAQAIAATTAGRMATGLYHLAASGETTWHGLAEFVVATARDLGAPLRVERVTPISTADYPTPARRPANSRLSTSRLRAALGIDLPDWRHHAARSVTELLERGTP